MCVSVPPCVSPQPGGEQGPHPLCQQCPEGYGTVSVPQSVSRSRHVGQRDHSWGWRAEVLRQRLGRKQWEGLLDSWHWVEGAVQGPNVFSPVSSEPSQDSSALFPFHPPSFILQGPGHSSHRVRVCRELARDGGRPAEGSIGATALGTGKGSSQGWVSDLEGEGMGRGRYRQRKRIRRKGRNGQEEGKS